MHSDEFAHMHVDDKITVQQIARWYRFLHLLAIPIQRLDKYSTPLQTDPHCIIAYVQIIRK